MFDVPAFYNYSSSHATPKPPPRPRSETPKPRRVRELEGKEGSLQANGSIANSREPSRVRRKTLGNPPDPALARRAQSYIDFHYAARSVLSKNETEVPLQRRKSCIQLKGRACKTTRRVPQAILDEQKLHEAKFSTYEDYLEELRSTESYLASLTNDTTAALKSLKLLAQDFRSVDEQTTSLEQQCRAMVGEHERLEQIAQAVGENLQFYAYLEPITRRLNAPAAGSFVRGREFSDMLARLDECLGYMTAHSEQREAATYKAKYKLLLTRGLTLIRSSFIGTLKEVTQDVSKKLNEKQIGEATVPTIVYAKFQVEAPELKTLAQEIVMRARPAPDAPAGTTPEYQSLLNELYTAYAASRLRLLRPILQKRFYDLSLSTNPEDLLGLAKNTVGFLKGLCTDEYALWQQWFVGGEEGLYDYLEQLCEPLSDLLQPRILRATSLVKLCELCSLLQTRYFNEDEDEMSPQRDRAFDFAPLIKPVLQDVQARVVFRALNLLRTEIEQYKPTPEELETARVGKLPGDVNGNGPKLAGRRTSAMLPAMFKGGEGAGEEADILNSKLSMAGTRNFETWYPTLRRAIWLLSRIYRLINSSVFDDLAHQIVHQTTLSLQRASQAISTKYSTADGQLFLLKYLLLLKQQIVAFDIEYVAEEVNFDFSGMTNTFYDLRERGGLFDPRNLFRLMGSNFLPRVVENMLDAKSELDGVLRTVINDFVIAEAMQITAPLKSTVGERSEATIFEIQSLANKAIPTIREKLEIYLDDPRIRETLVFALQDQVVQNYETFFDAWRAKRMANGQSVSSKGKGKEGELWDTVMFTDWAVEAFNVDKNAMNMDGGANGRFDNGVVSRRSSGADSLTTRGG